ncbi:MAG: response regulator [Verrucomicrobiales bacterium]|nr:response regulator [Verrucomicrobiales bacterium]
MKYVTQFLQNFSGRFPRLPIGLGIIGLLAVVTAAFYIAGRFVPALSSVVGHAGFAICIINSVLAIVLLYRQTAKQSKIETALATAENAAQGKMDFLARMSHEIRTPLGAMMGFAQLLEQARLSRDERGNLDGINLSGRFLLRILNDILDLSKIEAGGVELEKEPFGLTGLGTDVVQIMKPQATNNQVDLKFECSDLKGMTVIGDRHRVKQVLMNLVGNAIKFTPQGRVILRITAEKSGGKSAKVLFEVVDSGIGMSKSQIDRIFQPFSQGNATIARKFGGTGLGLPISKQLVGIMGGELAVFSEEEKGSCFSFALELEVSDEIETVNKPSERRIVKTPRRNASYLKILVAEDEQVNRTLISKIFQMLGYPVDFACDGIEAGEKLQSGERYDAIFLDYHMPHCDGLEMAARIKRGEFGDCNQNTRLILMTADATIDGKKAGFDDIVPKPLEIAKLQEVLDSIMPRLNEKKRLKALIVEDQELNRQMIGQIFTSFGLEPNYASDGVECIEFLKKNPDLDLILLDLRMPRMDGWTVARKIRSGEAGAEFTQIPIAVISAEIQAEQTCREIGVNEFFSKPFDVGQIRDFVNKVGEESGVALAG